MSAYMTGVKQNNGVISMSGDTSAIAPAADGSSRCTNGRAGADPAGAGESARPRHRHRHHHQRHRRHPGRDLCPRLPPQAAEPDRGDDGAGRRRLQRGARHGIDLVFGGGAQYFRRRRRAASAATAATCWPNCRRAATAWRRTRPAQALAPSTQPAIALFAQDDLAYDAERDPAKQPSLAEMTRKAVSLLAKGRR
jgi:alkaline phosphatase